MTSDKWIFHILFIAISVLEVAHAERRPWFGRAKATPSPSTPTPKPRGRVHTAPKKIILNSEGHDPSTVELLSALTNTDAAVDKLAAVKAIVEKIPKEKRAERLSAFWLNRSAGRSFLESMLVQPNYEVFKYLIAEGATVHVGMLRTAKNLQRFRFGNPSAELDLIIQDLQARYDAMPKYNPAESYAQYDNAAVEAMIKDKPPEEVTAQFLNMIGTVDPKFFPLFRDAGGESFSAALKTTTPLRRAILNNDPQAMAMLIELGADPQIEDPLNGQTVGAFIEEIEDDKLRMELSDLSDRLPGTKVDGTPPRRAPTVTEEPKEE